jgi:carbohydrate-selective porin OprB
VEPICQKLGQLRKQLDNRGIQFGIVYDGEVFSNTSGGLRRGTLYLGNLNLQLTLDGQHLIGWPGATALHGWVSSLFQVRSSLISIAEFGFTKHTAHKTFANLLGAR